MDKLEPVYVQEEAAYCPICHKRMTVFKTVKDSEGNVDRKWWCKNKSCSGKVSHGTTIQRTFDDYRRH